MSGVELDAGTLSNKVLMAKQALASLAGAAEEWDATLGRFLSRSAPRDLAEA